MEIQVNYNNRTIVVRKDFGIFEEALKVSLCRTH